jgi:hypothetical protein
MPSLGHKGMLGKGTQYFFGSDNFLMTMAGRQHRRMALRGLKLVENLLLNTLEQQ